ncbi:MAG: DNA repair protein RecN [Thermodesulfovibrionales bacterium]|nr:DNA repair protein RecN [Thermodesulfovibrionales bacterium]
MLSELGIKNFAIIKNLSVNFSKGLNLITGETGAGKSVIVDAISMLIAQRASAEYIKSGEKEAQIEAVFQDIPESIKSILDEISIMPSDELILRRIISTQGKNKAYINDTPVNIQTFLNITNNLIDIHGQSQHQNLLRRDTHLQLLDTFAKLTDKLSQYKSIYLDVQSIKNKLETIRNNLKDAIQREDFLRYQIREIESADPKINELEELLDEFKVLSHIQRLKELMHDAYESLYGAEISCYSRLRAAYEYIEKVCELDSTQADILNSLKDAMIIIDDTSNMLRNKKSIYEENPERLNYVSDRIDLLKRLMKKYGNSIAEVIQHKKNAEEEIKNLQLSNEEEKRLSDELLLLESKLFDLAQEISSKRKSASDEMTALVNDELKRLGFQNPNFYVSISTKQHPSINGMDVVEFFFSANPGEPPKPLNKVASGGELSRLMLALKVVCMNEQSDSIYEPNTLIFDEVDAGIGGITANNVGVRLKKLAERYQVLCITHLPQIAAFADYHLMIEKLTDTQGVRVKISHLTDDERLFEIARMLSGSVTETSLMHAKEMLQSKALQGEPR